ncbi:hypothetical protein EVA_11654 [gut metagenome]|uniref:Uncharacterized protein n=1 Tax=gut metagenome TaxID=749906 RepID=J9GEN3_9ZZZZ
MVLTVMFMTQLVSVVKRSTTCLNSACLVRTSWHLMQRSSQKLLSFLAASLGK